MTEDKLSNYLIKRKEEENYYILYIFNQNTDELLNTILTTKRTNNAIKTKIKR